MSYRKGPQLCLLACNPGDRFSSADVISSIEPPKNIEHIISMNFVYQKIVVNWLVYLLRMLLLL